MSYAALAAGLSTAPTLATDAPWWVVLIVVLTPVLVVVGRWVGLLIGREHFARKTPTVRADLLKLIALEKQPDHKTTRTGRWRRTGRAREDSDLRLLDP